MLYESLSQPYTFLIYTICGFLLGFTFDIKNIILHLFKNKRIFVYIFDFISVIFLLFSFFLINLRFNYGEFRVFSILIPFLSFLIERHISVNFVANPISKCYNNIRIKRNEKGKKQEV